MRSIKLMLAEARAAAADLKRRKFRYVNVAKRPYALQVGTPISTDEARKLKFRLQAKGYFSYSLPVASAPDRLRVLIGAFGSKQAAAGLVQRLEAEGFTPKIVLK